MYGILTYKLAKRYAYDNCIIVFTLMISLVLWSKVIWNDLPFRLLLFRTSHLCLVSFLGVYMHWKLQFLNNLFIYMFHKFIFLTLFWFTFARNSNLTIHYRELHWHYTVKSCLKYCYYFYTVKSRPFTWYIAEIGIMIDRSLIQVS